MKICVYAIAKNESKFIERWYNSVKEADYICVLDTGSSDDTFEKLKNLNILTKQKQYKQFRFDTARNDSMELIPEDASVCVCVDMDEILIPGWSKTLKSKWRDNYTQARFRYTWNFNPDNSEGIVFMSEKIHKNKLFKWTHPVHEILTPTSNVENNIIDIPEIRVLHYPDPTKSRSNYLPLLELSIKENPNDDRNMHYLGREYMYHGMYDKAIEILNKHLKLPNSKWDLERCASYRYIARCYQPKNDPVNQEKNLILATLEAPQSREPYFELGVFYFNHNNYLKSAQSFVEMFKIKTRELNYISSPDCWGSLPYDYLSICYFYLEEYFKAITTIQEAIKLDPTNNRLKNNLKIFMQENKCVTFEKSK